MDETWSHVQDRARNKEEVSQTKSMLTGAEIRSILAGPANLNYGHISASAEAVAHFCMNNPLGKPIHVLVDAKCHDHLCRSANMSQVRGLSISAAVLDATGVAMDQQHRRQCADYSSKIVCRLPPQGVL